LIFPDTDYIEAVTCGQDFNMDIVKESVIGCFSDFAGENDKIITELNKIVEKHGEETYSRIIHVLAHLFVEPEKAKNCWDKIIVHREMLSRCLKRDVTFQTAICDYFCSIEISLKNPKVVEISVFEEKEKASRFDNLTGLFNRNQFEDSISQELTRSKRHHQELSLLFFDLDNFKSVNDTYGHLAGDLVLKNVSRILLAEIRAEDIAIRYGGEELLIILPQTGKINALLLGDRIREKIMETPCIYQDKQINITVSGGLASFPADGEDFNELVEHADRGLYKAKSDGKNNIAIYSKNHRRFVRFDFVSEIQVQTTSDWVPPDIILASTRNLSETGLLFESEIAFNIGDMIQMHIQFKKNNSYTQITGTVVRIEIYQANRYDIGVSFIKIDPAAQNELSSYVNRLISQK